MADEETTTPTWGYSADEARIFHLAADEDLPAGFYHNPASVPGSAAEAAYRADAEREGAPTPLITLVEPVVPPPVKMDPAPEKPAKKAAAEGEAAKS